MNNLIDGLFFPEHLKFDAYIKPADELKIGEFRLLETDNSLYLPANIPVRFLMTSNDVIHS